MTAARSAAHVVTAVVGTPNWTYGVTSDGGTTNCSRVEVEFTNTATKERVSVRTAAGGTVIT